MTAFFDVSLYLVAGPTFAKMPFLAAVESAVAGGVTCVQFREKTGNVRDWLPVCYDLRALCKRMGVSFIVNDRVDLAMAVDADGVHLGQSDFPYVEARKLLGPKKIIGISTHSADEAVAAERAGADYIGVGPMAATLTKLDTEPILGPEGLRKIRAHVQLPIVAIGGIKESNAELIMRSGASGLAVVSSILSADDPGEAAKKLRKCIQMSRGE